MRLRQIALVAHALEPVVDDLCAVLGLEVCFHDPGVETFGLRNALMPLGPDAFLEVISPLRPGTAAGRQLERSGGDGGYMVIVQTDDLAADRARMAALGVRIVWEVTLPDAATIHLHPRDVGGAILSLDAMDPPASWRWAGPDWQRHVRTDVTERLLGATLAAHDPAAMSARWASVLGRPASPAGGGAWVLPVGDASLVFAPVPSGGGECLAGVALRVRDPETVRARAAARGLSTPPGAVVVGGTRFALGSS